MRKRIDGLVIAWLVCVCAVASNAGDPPILITEPLVIDEPGSYILSRDIAIDWNTPGSPLIVTASDVDIDFDNHWVTGQFGTGDPVVLVFGDRVRLHNGTIDGDLEDPPAIRVMNTIGFVIEDMLLDSGGGVELNNVSGFLLSELVIVHGGNAAIYGSGSQGTIIDCDTFHIGQWGAALWFQGHDLLVRSNTFNYAIDGFALSGSENRVIDNRLIEPDWVGMEIFDCENCNVRENYVSGPVEYCYSIGMDDGFFERNECAGSHSGGLSLGGSRNTIRDNVMVGLDYGTGYSIGGNDNRHCRNQSRNFPVAHYDGGSGNKSCESLELIETACANGPLGQPAAFQLVTGCSMP